MGSSPVRVGGEDQVEWKASRKQLAQKPLRIIYNDDGGAIITGSTPEEFIAIRLKHIANTHVDTVFDNTSQTTVFQHTTKVAEAIDGSIDGYDANADVVVRPTTSAVSDRPVPTVSHSVWTSVDGMTLKSYWSLRMNDILDALPGEIWRHG